jgi:hypothetical protein
MPFEPNRLLNLSIDWNTTGIPYPAEDHLHGSRNFGFRSLKGRTKECVHIPEAEDDSRLAAALERLNAWATAFFTSGCEKCYNYRDGEARPIGYIQFCFNSIESAKSATSYFELYHGLYEMMRTDRYESEVGFLWNLSRTSFNERGVSGYSASVFLQAFGYLPEELALEKWHRAIDYLVAYLCQWPDPGPAHFYPRVTDAGVKAAD